MKRLGLMKLLLDESLPKKLSGFIAPNKFDDRRLMPFDWSALTFTPPPDAVTELVQSWSWLLQESFEPVLFSIFGDVFYQPESGGIWWLNTGTAEVTRVAESVPQFRNLMGTAVANDWFMPSLVEKLHCAGKIPTPGQCYTYVTLPVFAEGKYEIDNLNPVPAREHFGVTGCILRQIQNMPSGANVRVNITH